MRLPITDLDVRLLRIFLAVAENGGFSAAQADLNLSTSAISTYMNDLETRLGLRLCRRGPSGFKLTAAGREVVRETKELFSYLEQFRSRLARRRERLSGVLTIGIIDNFIGKRALPLHEAISRFWGQVDDVQLVVYVSSPLELEKGVVLGQFDFAIGPCFQRIQGVKYEDLIREDMALYCGSSHPLFGRKDKSITEEEIASALLVARGYQPKVDIGRLRAERAQAMIFSMEAAVMLILSGRFIGFLPRHLAERWVRSKQLRAVQPNLYSYSDMLTVITRSGEAENEIARLLISEIRRLVPSNLDDYEYV